MQSNLYIGIDPGKNGGVCLLNNEGDYYRALAFRCPDSDSMHKTLLEHMANFKVDFDNIYVAIEKVWAFPSDARSSAFKFGFNSGIWMGILYAMDLNIKEVIPREWMKFYDMPKMDKKNRKKWLKELSEKLYPNIKVTYNVSDAILIANYLKEIKTKN